MKISIIGQGYVGLPLSIKFSKIKNFKVVGFDLNATRIKQLNEGIDINKEFKKKDFINNKKIIFTNNDSYLNNSDFYIITVPTPVTLKNKPDFQCLIKASKLIGKYVQLRSVIINESTVYPGATENIVIPIIEKISGVNRRTDNLAGFGYGYCPERINAGDKINNLENTVKVISACDSFVLSKIKKLYKKIIKNIYCAETIQVAEMSKVVENAQRDVNIAFMNEVSMICKSLDISSQEVLKTAYSKWNFVKFKPGLVGGHCIGVDPYYLIERAKEKGFRANLLIKSREINNKVPNYIFKNILKKFIEKKIILNESKILICGVTFKENVTDTRNSKIFEIAEKLEEKSAKVYMYDPLANNLATNIKIFRSLKQIKKLRFDLIIFATFHNIFSKEIKKIYKLKKNSKSIIFDIQSKIKNSDFYL
jgi:UDP-N-acetyl-D-galactosamine dehydrogenase